MIIKMGVKYVVGGNHTNMVFTIAGDQESAMDDGSKVISLLIF